MEFEAALAQEALGVFGRTGMTPSQLADKVAAARLAADGILALLTMEYGRLMEENPDYEMVVSFGEHEVSMPASRFMALYRATE